MYLLDTNIYLAAAEDPTFANETAAFVEDADQPLGVSRVVVAELLIGVRSEVGRTEVIDNVYATIPSRFVLTPIPDDWERAADALRQLGGSASTPRIARQIPVRFLRRWP